MHVRPLTMLSLFSTAEQPAPKLKRIKEEDENGESFMVEWLTVLNHSQ